MYSAGLAGLHHQTYFSTLAGSDQVVMHARGSQENWDSNPVHIHTPVR